jgi:hypothetical protein
MSSVPYYPKSNIPTAGNNVYIWSRSAVLISRLKNCWLICCERKILFRLKKTDYKANEEGHRRTIRMPVNLKKSCTSVPLYAYSMLENYPQETIKTLEEYE